MYLDFYGLREKPFTLSPNPKYLFYSHRHKEALSQIIYAVTQHHGYMVLTGEVGTGKTTLINALLNCLPEDFIVAKIYHTVLSPKGLIQNICKEFGIEFANCTMAELVFKLHEYLKWSCHAGKKSILILDEAQNLSQNILEEIRLLSNFEAMQQKFLQILLVGQLELDAKLQTENLRPLQERIGLRFQLDRLSREDTKNYINHRLEVAGCQYVGDLFTEHAIEQIYDLSGGIPRRINILCDNALLMGYAKNSREINAEIIEKVGVEDIADEMEEVMPGKYADRLQKGHGDATTSSDTLVATSEKLGVEQHVSVEKNGKLPYAKFEKFMGRFLFDHKLLIVQKPSFTRLLSAAMLIFMVFLVAFLLAILFAQKLGILR